MEDSAWAALARRLEVKLWSAAEAVLPVSNVLADIVQSAGVAEDRIHVVPNGVDPDRFFPGIDGAEVRRRLGLGNKVVLGFSGFVRPWHGLDRVIDVMAKCESACDLVFSLSAMGQLGPTWSRRRVTLASVDRVRFVGAVDRKELPRYLAAFDIALQPSAVAYACPLKLVEYMAMGKAIIAPDQPNIRELIRIQKWACLSGKAMPQD